MKEFECFKIENADIYFAVNLNKDVYIRVILLKDETGVTIVQNKNRTRMKYNNCVDAYTPVTTEKFIEALRKADNIQNNLPFTLLKTRNHEKNN